MWGTASAPQRWVAPAFRALAAAAALCATAGVPAQDVAADLPAAARSGASLLRCGSVVVRHCAVHAASASVVRDPRQGALVGPASAWASARLFSLDEDEIVITGQALPGSRFAAAFDRMAGPPVDAAGFATYTLPNGSRCTVIARTGATFCAQCTGAPPERERLLSDWVF